MCTSHTSFSQVLRVDVISSPLTHYYIVGRPYEKTKASGLGVMPNIDILVFDIVYRLYHKIVFVTLSSYV